MTVRERVARDWHAGSDHAAESPFGGPLCNCWQVAERIMPMLAEAWDDGYKCGGMDERHDWNGWVDPFENPYRIEEDRHVDQ